jgi:hypothetical protein
MKCTMRILAAAVVSVAVFSAAYAGPGKGNGGSHHTGGSQTFSKQSHSMQTNPSNYQGQFKSQKFDHIVRSDRVQLNHIDKGFKYSIEHCPSKSYKKCDFGYCFYGKSCNHWEYRCWAPTYGCYLYSCPYTSCEYWFCLEDDCYYPVGYCPVAYRVKYKFGW